MKTTILGALKPLLVLATLVPLGLVAQTPEPDRPARAERPARPGVERLGPEGRARVAQGLERMWERLDLTEEQRAQMREIRAELGLEAREQRAALQERMDAVLTDEQREMLSAARERARELVRERPGALNPRLRGGVDGAGRPGAGPRPPRAPRAPAPPR